MSAPALAIRASHAARRRHSASMRDLRADRHPNEPHSGPLRPLRAVGGTLGTPAGSALHGAWPRRPCLHIAGRWAAASRPRRRLDGPEMVGTAYHSLDVPALSAGLFALRRSHEPQKLPVRQTGSTPANQPYFLIAALAWNLKTWMLNLLRLGDGAVMRCKPLLYLWINQAGVVANSGRDTVVLRLPAGEYYQRFGTALARVAAL